MATGTSLILIAVGAILALAVDYTATGINIQTIGLILMVVGIIGLLYSMMFLASFAPFGGGTRTSGVTTETRERVVDSDHTHV